LLMCLITLFNFSNLTRFMEQPKEQQGLIAHLHEKYPSLCGRTYALMVAGTNAMFAISSKFLDKRMPFQLVGSLQMVVAVPVLCYLNRKEVPYSADPVVNLALFLRGVFGSFFALLFTFGALILPSSKFIVLVNTSSIFVVIIAPFVLKEYPTRFILSMVVFSFLGIILLVDPSMLLPASWLGSPKPQQLHPDYSPWYYILPLVCGLAAAVISIFLKYFGKRITPYMNGFWFTTFVAFYNGVALATKDIKPNEHTLPTTMKDLLILLGEGLCLFGFQLFITLAVKYERRASLVTMLLQSAVLFTFILDFVIFKTNPSPVNIIGAIIICGSATAITLSKEQAQQQASSPPTVGQQSFSNSPPKV